MPDLNVERNCPFCSQPMEDGFITDMGRNSRRMPFWVEGEPEASWGSLAVKGRRAYELRAMRCPGCGFVANMATKPKKI